ncbi:hypothetical protein [Halomonas getboli]|uniref:hypothetical protein n=1 Tax=Halomonas getboli TaxID=2935862 RepID=UPI001FFF479D|nr:hypothetical protein [Halomonas getboli]MCK2185094.1 hypothetical protein [Halomonas getboli]
MKTKMIAASLLLAALPLAAQADNAAERALLLNQEPLSTATAQSAAAQDASQEDVVATWGASEAMAQARLRLNAQQQTRIAASDYADELARQATQG